MPEYKSALRFDFWPGPLSDSPGCYRVFRGQSLIGIVRCGKMVAALFSPYKGSITDLTLEEMGEIHRFMMDCISYGFDYAQKKMRETTVAELTGKQESQLTDAQIQQVQAVVAGELRDLLNLLSRGFSTPQPVPLTDPVEAIRVAVEIVRLGLRSPE